MCLPPSALRRWSLASPIVALPLCQSASLGAIQPPVAEIGVSGLVAPLVPNEGHASGALLCLDIAEHEGASPEELRRVAARSFIDQLVDGAGWQPRSAMLPSAL